MNTEKAIVVKNLSRHFGDFIAVDNISFEVSRGEIFGFLGPNGAGKSTTIRMLNGLLLPTSGEGRVGGFDIIRENAQIKNHIGYMSQRFSLYEDLTGEENLTFFGGVYGLTPARLKERITEVLRLVGLEDKMESYPDELSGGEQQRVSIARAFVNRPPLLLADEPTGNLDPTTSLGIMSLLNRINKTGTTVLVATHDREMVDSMRKRVIALEGGKVVRDQDRGVYGYGD